ncbi:type I-E CRISPR-associated protein Cas6/Cse3/CasE [Streptomyces sp. XH2]|uniref:type I-E CRISPR-associated protein Cas6/Cse3/CasE n=1 Tax=Streptomyces sp. XH2 TaxID=3412483 RepID=UPI003C797BCF
MGKDAGSQESEQNSAIHSPLERPYPIHTPLDPAAPGQGQAGGHRAEVLTDQAGERPSEVVGEGWKTFAYGQFLDTLTEGGIWAFRLTANPVHHIRRAQDPTMPGTFTSCVAMPRSPTSCMTCACPAVSRSSGTLGPAATDAPDAPGDEDRQKSPGALAFPTWFGSERAVRGRPVVECAGRVAPSRAPSASLRDELLTLDRPPRPWCRRAIGRPLRRGVRRQVARLGVGNRGEQV